MNINRQRPPPECRDLALWLSGVINDAMRDATEAGLLTREARQIARILGRDESPTTPDGAPRWTEDAYEAAAAAMFAYRTERNIVLAQCGVRAFIRIAHEHGYTLRADTQPRKSEETSE